MLRTYHLTSLDSPDTLLPIWEWCQQQAGAHPHAAQKTLSEKRHRIEIDARGKRLAVSLLVWLVFCGWLITPLAAEANEEELSNCCIKILHVKKGELQEYSPSQSVGGIDIFSPHFGPSTIPNPFPDVTIRYQAKQAIGH